MKSGPGPLSHPFHQYPIAFLDYLWVIIIYISATLSLAIFIDGYFLPPFDQEESNKDTTFVLFCKILLQLAMQGFIVILISAILQQLPSPVNGIFGYDKTGSLGLIIRNPAIITMVLFSLSKSLHGRLLTFFSRFDINAQKALQK